MRDDETEWPPPAEDPELEPGEDPDTHLLPNRERWRELSRRDRRELLELIEDWRGPDVERWHREVAR
jgi:hypothetical protein